MKGDFLPVEAAGRHGQDTVGTDDMAALDDKGTGSHWTSEVKVVVVVGKLLPLGLWYLPMLVVEVHPETETNLVP